MAAKNKKTDLDALLDEAESVAVSSTNYSALGEDLPLPPKSETAPSADTKSFTLVELFKLHNNPYNKREILYNEEFDALVEAMKEEGFLGTLNVRPHPQKPGEYQIDSGHRRREAAKKAGISRIPVSIESISDYKMLMRAVRENTLRTDPSPIEEALLFKDLLDNKEISGMTQERIADRIGKSRGFVRNRLELLNMPKDVQGMVDQMYKIGREGIRAAYYLKDAPETHRKLAIERLLATEERERITGEAVPQFLAALKQQEPTDMEIVEEKHPKPKPEGESHILAMRQQSIKKLYTGFERYVTLCNESPDDLPPITDEEVEILQRWRDAINQRLELAQ